MSDSDQRVPSLGVEDVQREFPDWNVVMDRDFTGQCFAYQRDREITLIARDPAALRDKIRDWLGQPRLSRVPGRGGLYAVPAALVIVRLSRRTARSMWSVASTCARVPMTRTRYTRPCGPGNAA